MNIPEPLAPITDVKALLYSLLGEQYRDPRVDGQSVKLAGIIDLIAAEAQLLETALQELLPVLDVDAVGGVLLDTIGRIANTARGAMDDPAYRLALKAAFQRSDSGTPEQIISAVKQVTGSAKVWYIPEYPAGYWIIYDGHGLAREYLEQISPAGVLAFPGCYLADAHDDLIRTATGEPILVVGPCEGTVFPEDRTWDGGVGAVDPDDFKLDEPWPFRDGTGVGQNPDAGVGPIVPSQYTFTDGTFAENP